MSIPQAKKRQSPDQIKTDSKKFKYDKGGGSKKPMGNKFNNKFANKKNFNNDKFGSKKPQFNKAAGSGSGGAGAAGQTVSDKQDWRKFKAEKKELKLKRKQGRDLFELTVEGKKIYEQLKCKNVKNKDELAKELHKLLNGPENYQKLVLAHDTARIVQCLLKYASCDIRKEISQKLISKVPEMSLSKYAHFCVLRMIKYGAPDIKQQVIEATYGNLLKMINNTHASTILDVIYVSWASAQQKAYLRQEFYGDLYKTAKDDSVKSIADTFANSPHMKLAVINSVKANLNHVVNKKLIDNSLVHAVLLDYLNECSEEELLEMSTAYSPYIPSLASTKDGTRASMIFFFHGVVKDRRAIVKTLKEHLVKLCTHEHAYVLILAIINAMDDTKAIKKAIFDNIFAQIEYVVANEWGRNVIEWLVAPADTSLFHPQIISYLEEGMKFSKKDKETRRSEIFDAVEEPLCNAIAKNPTFWLRGGHTGFVTAAILKKSKGTNSQLAFDKLAEVICDSNWQISSKEENVEQIQENSALVIKEKTTKIAKKYKNPLEKKEEVKEPLEKIFGVEHAGLHIILKKILKEDKIRTESGEPTFGSSIANHLTPETVKIWLGFNRAAFLLLIIFEQGTPETCVTIKNLLTEHKQLLKKQKHTGASLLLKKVTV